MDHLVHFVWMSKGGGEPEQVEADPVVISQKMVAGYVQVFPENETSEEKN